MSYANTLILLRVLTSYSSYIACVILVRSINWQLKVLLCCMTWWVNSGQIVLLSLATRTVTFGSHCFPDSDFRLFSDFLDAERYLVILRKEVKLGKRLGITVFQPCLKVSIFARKNHYEYGKQRQCSDCQNQTRTTCAGIRWICAMASTDYTSSYACGVDKQVINSSTPLRNHWLFPSLKRKNTLS